MCAEMHRMFYGVVTWIVMVASYPPAGARAADPGVVSFTVMDWFFKVPNALFVAAPIVTLVGNTVSATLAAAPLIPAVLAAPTVPSKSVVVIDNVTAPIVLLIPESLPTSTGIGLLLLSIAPRSSMSMAVLRVVPTAASNRALVAKFALSTAAAVTPKDANCATVVVTVILAVSVEGVEPPSPLSVGSAEAGAANTPTIPITRISKIAIVFFISFLPFRSYSYCSCASTLPLFPRVWLYDTDNRDLCQYLNLKI